MADEIKYEQIVDPGVKKGLADLKKSLIDVDKLLQDIAKTGKSVKIDVTGGKGGGKELENVNAQTEKLKQNTKELTQVEIEKNKITQQLAIQEAKLQASYSNNAIELQKVKIAQQENSKAITNSLKEDQLKEGSIKKLGVTLANNKKRYTEMSKAERENSKAGKELKKTIIDQDKEYKKLQVDIGNTAVKVGSYREAINDTINSMSDVSPVAGKAVGGVKALGAQFKKLLLNPVILIIAGIVAAITLMTKAFKRTREGQTAFKTLTATVSAGSDVMLGKIGSFIKSITADGGFKKALNNISEGWSNFVTKIKGDGFGAAIKSQVDKSIKAIKGLGKEIKDVADRASEIEKLRNAVFDLGLSVKVSTAELEKLAEIERVTADDSTKSFLEREAAAVKAQKASEAAAYKRIELTKLDEKLIYDQLKIKRETGAFDEELESQYADATVARIEAEKTYTIAVKQNERQRNEIRRDRLERDLDFIIDVFDSQKTANEKIINSDAETLTERQRLLNETSKIANESFSQQIDVIKQFTDANIDVNKLLKLNNKDSIEYVRTLKLDEIVEGRVLEIIKERRFLESDLLEAQKGINKATLEDKKKIFDEEQKLNESRFDLLQTQQAAAGKSEAEIEAEKILFRINQQKALYDFIVANEKNISDAQLEIMRNSIAQMEAELKKVADTSDETFGGSGGFWQKALGLTDEQYAATTAILSEAINTAVGLVDAFNEIANNKDEERLSKIEDNYNTQSELLQSQLDGGLISQQQYNEQSQALDKQVKKEKKKIAKEQAKREKEAALFSAIVNTAVGIVTALATMPTPVGIVLAALVGILGAAQIAAIASQPEPSFAKGGEADWSTMTGFTGDGDSKAESLRLGKKPYKYHKKEYIWDAKTYGKNADLIDGIKQGRYNKHDLNRINLRNVIDEERRNSQLQMEMMRNTEATIDLLKYFKYEQKSMFFFDPKTQKYYRQIGNYHLVQTDSLPN
jgi:hypothetical protein